MKPMSYLLIAAGGAVGAMARYWIGSSILSGGGLPWATIAINVGGSFLIGLLGTLAIEQSALSAPQRQLLLTGFLGGFTTYSAFSFEFQLLIHEGDHLKALAYLSLTVLGAMAAVFAGAALARQVG
ncbi:MAG: fluoride efflux transporter CrcB [Dehalococcoidia bacterium]|nr:fluoride efflux transporter CrcB [Dehalococcoidia bacterium]